MPLRKGTEVLNAPVMAADDGRATQRIVYRLDQGRLKASTAYVHWMDVHTQVGLVDPAALLSLGAFGVLKPERRSQEVRRR